MLVAYSFPEDKFNRIKEKVVEILNEYHIEYKFQWPHISILDVPKVSKEDKEDIKKSLREKPTFRPKELRIVEGRKRNFLAVIFDVPKGYKKAHDFLKSKYEIQNTRELLPHMSILSIDKKDTGKLNEVLSTHSDGVLKSIPSIIKPRFIQLWNISQSSGIDDVEDKEFQVIDVLENRVSIDESFELESDMLNEFITDPEASIEDHWVDEIETIIGDIKFFKKKADKRKASALSNAEVLLDKAKGFIVKEEDELEEAKKKKKRWMLAPFYGKGDGRSGATIPPFRAPSANPVPKLGPSLPGPSGVNAPQYGTLPAGPTAPMVSDTDFATAIGQCREFFSELSENFHICLVCSGTGKVGDSPCKMCSNQWRSKRAESPDETCVDGTGLSNVVSFSGFDKPWDLDL